MKTIIRQATIVNEQKQFIADLLIHNGRIEKISKQIDCPNEHLDEINAEGLYLLPGMIDDQVHFRDPGLTYKADIASESRAAIAGGITSFMDMPNTIPNTLTQILLEEKYKLASMKSLANFSFFMGISKDNLDEALRTDTETVCGITDDGLYFDNEEGILANYPEFLEQLFSKSSTLVALHSEDDVIIRNNLNSFKKRYGENIQPKHHSEIRSAEACLESTKRVIDIAKKYNNRLHFFHISTGQEALLFDNTTKAREKRITAEACIHHLVFNTADYEKLGNKIKWNPSIKSNADNELLIKCLNDNHLDIVATDHAPHSWSEKTGDYFQSKSGGPLVQHALIALLELYHDGKMSLEKIVEKTSHHVSDIYRIIDRGYIREGFYADFVLVDLNTHQRMNDEELLYKCGWSPFSDKIFRSKIKKTFVNGNLVFDEGLINDNLFGHRLLFEKIR
jgi:dihydroorotase